MWGQQVACPSCPRFEITNFCWVARPRSGWSKPRAWMASVSCPSPQLWPTRSSPCWGTPALGPCFYQLPLLFHPWEHHRVLTAKHALLESPELTYEHCRVGSSCFRPGDHFLLPTSCPHACIWTAQASVWWFRNGPPVCPSRTQIPLCILYFLTEMQVKYNEALHEKPSIFQDGNGPVSSRLLLRTSLASRTLGAEGMWGFCFHCRPQLCCIF